jgi:hypothetical protein
LLYARVAELRCLQEGPSRRRARKQPSAAERRRGALEEMRRRRKQRVSSESEEGSDDDEEEEEEEEEKEEEEEERGGSAGGSSCDGRGAQRKALQRGGPGDVQVLDSDDDEEGACGASLHALHACAQLRAAVLCTHRMHAGSCALPCSAHIAFTRSCAPPRSAPLSRRSERPCACRGRG